MCEDALPKAESSNIVQTLAYSNSLDSMSLIATGDPKYDPVYPEMHRLEWPTNKAPLAGVWWAKWSGTVQVLDPGMYKFNLDVGFNTVTQLQVDGVPLLTDGQCAIAKNKKNCEAKHCTWIKAKAECKAEGKNHSQPINLEDKTCGKGKYRSSPIVFGCDPASGVVDATLGPSGTTTIMTIPAGVSNFELSVTSQTEFGVQIFDPSTHTWVLNFGQGLVNNQAHEGTYHGQLVSFSGYVGETQSFTLSGTTPTALEVSIVNYGANPADAQLEYMTHGLEPCPGPNAEEGCQTLNAAEGQKMTTAWCDALNQRYGTADKAWEAIVHDYPGGDITWHQWASVYPMAWGQEAESNNPTDPAHPGAWQKTFAVIDADSNGHITQDEFFKNCHHAAASPASAPPQPQFKSNPMTDCTTVKVRDRSQWEPKDPFAGTGYSDSNLLSQLFTRTEAIQEKKSNGVMLASPFGQGPKLWFFPKGTWDCVQWTMPSPAPAPAPAPSLMQVTAASTTEPVKNEMFLNQGGHCIEAIVQVTSGAETLALKYAGRDTNNAEVVVPGLLVHCDPIVQACTNKDWDQCSKYKKQCNR
jgi:hypothetical protein